MSTDDRIYLCVIRDDALTDTLFLQQLAESYAVRRGDETGVVKGIITALGQNDPDVWFDPNGVNVMLDIIEEYARDLIEGDSSLLSSVDVSDLLHKDDSGNWVIEPDIRSALDSVLPSDAQYLNPTLWLLPDGVAIIDDNLEWTGATRGTPATNG